MITFLLFIFQWVLVLIFFAVFIAFCVWIVASFKSKVPFIPAPNSILSEIHKVLNIKDDSIVYDLGSGDGRVLINSAKITPKATYIGIENNPLPVALSRISLWRHRRTIGSNVSILKKDFFDHDLSDATHVFTYLYPSVMDDLLTKFEREFSPGTKLVSISFQFTQKRPIREIDLKRSKYMLARKIYIYEF